MRKVISIFHQNQPNMPHIVGMILEYEGKQMFLEANS